METCGEEFQDSTLSARGSCYSSLRLPRHFPMIFCKNDAQSLLRGFGKGEGCMSVQDRWLNHSRCHIYPFSLTAARTISKPIFTGSAINISLYTRTYLPKEAIRRQRFEERCRSGRALLLTQTNVFYDSGIRNLFLAPKICFCSRRLNRKIGNVFILL